MSSTTTVNFAKQLRGKAVLVADTGQIIGEVLDAILDPIHGEVLGITLRTQNGNERALSTSDFIIAEKAVLAAEGALRQKEEVRTVSACSCSELLGSSVVTDQGQWVGRVIEIHISIDRLRTAYRVVESGFQAFWGGGFFMPGSAARAYSRAGARVIVPDGLTERYTASSPAEAI